MRMISWSILVALCIPPVASAQSTPQRILGVGGNDAASIASTPDPAVGAVVSAVMPRAAIWGVVKGVPFSATEIRVREQTLADGTVIKSTVEVQLWRDGEGRMRAESKLNLKSGGAPQGRVVTIWNPIEGRTITWITGNQSANFASVTHLPELQLNGMMNARASAPLQGASSRPLRAAALPVPQPSAESQDTANIHAETLPVDSIGGLEVTGTRTTQVVPAGSIYNDRDFTVTSETWVSPELKTTVRQMTSDPRTGTVTTELSNIDRSEPDPALFKPPAGFKLVDNPDPNTADSGARP